MEFIKEKMKMTDEYNLKIVLADSCGYFNGSPDAELSWHGCNAGVVSCGITSNGKINGCLSLPNEFIE